MPNQESMAPCQWACPTKTDVPRYVRLLVEGDFYGAWKINRLTNVLPNVCSLVCLHPCEKACKRKNISAMEGDPVFQEPVGIRALKKYAADNLPPDYQERFLEEALPIKQVGKRVAVVGTGPAGLTVANDLLLAGCEVTAFEALPLAGGMLRVGIPPFRLPRRILDEEIGLLQKLGLEIRVNTAIGKDISLADLCSSYDAVFIAAGAHKPKKLEIPREDFEGVYHGIIFLRRINLGEPVDLVGKVVAVVGGGFTATDCARTALRVGAREVYVLYRRSEKEMPMGLEAQLEMLAEGITLHCLVSPIEFIGNEANQVIALRCIRNTLGEPDESGRRRPVPIAGSEFELKADVAIPAIDQEPDHSLLLPGLEVDTDTLQTNQKGLFAGGDFISGTRNVIDVIAEAHCAAEGMLSYLLGEDPKTEVAEPQEEVLKCPWLGEEPEKIPRQRVSQDGHERCHYDLFEEAKGYTREEALREATRCLQCNCSIVIKDRDCLYCTRCVNACPQNALSLTSLDRGGIGESEEWFIGGHWHRRGDTAIVLDRDLCTQCGICTQVCPLKNLRLISAVNA